MYGGLGANVILEMGMGGLDPEIANAMTSAMYNGHLYTGEPDGVYAGGVLLKFNVKTGETKILMSHDTDGVIPTFRDAVKFNDKLYFVGMVLDTNNSELTQQEIQTHILWQNGFPCIYEVDPANGDKVTCVYDCVDVNGFRQMVADNVFTSTRAIGIYKNTMIAGGLNTDGAYLVASKDPSKGEQSFSVIADMDDLFNYPKIKRTDANGGGGIYQVIEYNNDLYVVICAGDLASRNPETGTLRGFAIVKGECSGDPTRKSSWKWSVLAGDKKDGAKYPFALDEERVSAVACTLQVYGDYLYIGDYNDTSSALQGFVLNGDFTTLATNLEQSVNLYRMDKNERIEKVVGDPTKAFPKSLTGIGSGYDTHMSQYTWQATVYNDKLYISTLDLSTFLRPFVMLTNGDLLHMEKDEWKSQINYLRVLVELLAQDETSGVSAYSARSRVEQAAQSAARKKTGRLDAKAIELTDDQLSMLNQEAGKKKPSMSMSVVSKLMELNDKIDQLIDSFDAKNPEAFANDYAAVMEKYSSISDQLPENLKAMYTLILSIATENNIKGLASSVKYMTTAIPGFDVYEISHVEDGGVNVGVLTKNGFGDRYNHGLRIFEEMEDYWVIGTANPFYGTQLWRTKNITPDVPAGDGEASDNGNVSQEQIDELPQTGDNSSMAVWAVMLIVSAMGVCMLMSSKKENA